MECAAAAAVTNIAERNHPLKIFACRNWTEIVLIFEE